jgi:hypothetical protein
VRILATRFTGGPVRTVGTSSSRPRRETPQVGIQRRRERQPAPCQSSRSAGAGPLVPALTTVPVVEAHPERAQGPRQPALDRQRGRRCGPPGTENAVPRCDGFGDCFSRSLDVGFLIGVGARRQFVKDARLLPPDEPCPRSPPSRWSRACTGRKFLTRAITNAYAEAPPPPPMARIFCHRGHPRRPTRRRERTVLPY